MIHKTDIQKMVRHIIRRGDGIPDRRIMHPIRDWSIGVILSALIFVAVAGYAGYTFYTILVFADSGELPAELTKEVVAYDEVTVQSVLELYAGRAFQFDALRNDTSNFLTPVIAEEIIAEDDGSDGDEGVESGPVEEE